MAEAVFEIYNPDGTLKLSLNNRTYKVLTYIPTYGNNGSTTVSGVSGQLVAVGMGNGYAKDVPKVSVNGNTVSWSFDGARENDENSRVMIGML